MNIISEQEFGELLDEFIRDGEFRNKTGNFEEDKKILNRMVGRTEKLENIEDRLPQMDERIKEIAALSDLAEIVEVDMLLGPDKIFQDKPLKFYPNHILLPRYLTGLQILQRRLGMKEYLLPAITGKEQ